MTSVPFKLVKNDGSEEFTLKTTNVKLQKSNNIVIRSILSAIGGLAGATPVLAKTSWKIDFVIRDMDAADYPNSGTYSSTPNTDNYGFYEELRRAFDRWGPTTADGLDTLEYDGRSVDVAFSDLQLNENPDGGDPPREYSGTIEMATYSVYIG